METDRSQFRPPKARRRGWFRRLCWLGALLIVLLGVAGFVLTSSAFFKGVILPRVSAAMNADITVSDATIRPFSRVELRGLEVKPRGRETLLSAREIRLRYDLMAILRGNLVVSELVMDGPSLQVVQQADGTSNLDPLLGTQPPEQGPAPVPEPGVGGGSPRMDVQRVVMSDATFRWIRHHAGGQRDLSESRAVRVVLEDLKNGGAGKLEVGGVIQVDLNPPAPGTNALLQASLEGGFRFQLAPDLRLRAVQGDARIEVRQAGGALGDLNALQLVLACDWSPPEIRELALRLQRAGVDLAAMTLMGPFDAAKGEGRVRVELWGVDRQLLNLVGAPWGAQFNDTKLASTNLIELSQGGGSIAASGRLIASDFSVTQTGLTTPEFDFTTEFEFAVEQNALELRTARLNLAPTSRASNQIDASGRIDLTDPEAITGKLRFTAETLDATAIYDTWEAATPAPGSTVPTDSTVPASDPAEVELEAMVFPFREFVCEVEIGRFWLREVEMTHWQTRLQLDGGRMVLDPIKLNLNGAQVDGVMDLNLGVAGAEYDLKLKGDRIPVEPLVNSFLPHYRGQAKGDLFGQVQVKGAGTTDASLRRNLSGRNSLSLTNAAIQTAVLTNLFGVLERSSNLYVRTAWRLLEPTSIPFKMLSPVLTSISSKLALGDLSNLPLSGFDARADIREGDLNTACNLWSPAFVMNVGGGVTLATVLTNSTIRDWPVKLSLARAVARKVPYLAGPATADAAYVPLPVLFKVKGTVGLPATSFDAAAFAQWTAQSLLQDQTVGGIDAGNVVRGLSDLLGGRKPGEKGEASPTPEGVDTNAPASPLNDLLERLNRPRK